MKGKFRDGGLYKAWDVIVHKGWSGTELGRLLTHGSRRETLDKVLGLGVKNLSRKENTVVVAETASKSLFTTMVKTEAAINVSSAQAKEADLTRGQGVDMLVRNASLHKLRSAQEQFVAQEAKQMKRRAQLDTFWARTVKAELAIPAAIAAKYGLAAVQPWFQANALEARTLLNELARAAGDALNCLSPGSGVSEEAVQIIRDAHESAISWQRRITNTWEAATTVTTYGQGVADLVSKGVAAAAAGLTGIEGIKGFFAKRTGLAATRPTIR
jgi:hypothetical protein